MTQKLKNAYKTIGEVAEILNLKNDKTGKPNTYVLRFWEKEFKQIKPIILNNKRRYYDQKTIDTLLKIKSLLKDKGMTIKGVKKALNNNRFDLDENLNPHINTINNNIKIRLNKVSKILKSLKKIK